MAAGLTQPKGAASVRVFLGMAMMTSTLIGVAESAASGGGSSTCELFGLNCQLCLAAGCSWQNPGGCRPACDFPGPACFSGGVDPTCPQPECSAHDGDCAMCLRAGCGYKKSGQCQNTCSSPKGCVAPGSEVARCPGYGEICKQATSCEDCVEAKCVYQGGVCKPACDRSGGFIAGGCIDKDSTESGLTCSALRASDDAVSHGYCAHDCIGEPVEDGWCQESAGHCVTGCRQTWCPADGFCSFNGCAKTEPSPWVDSWCHSREIQCGWCGGQWCRSDDI